MSSYNFIVLAHKFTLVFDAVMKSLLITICVGSWFYLLALCDLLSASIFLVLFSFFDNLFYSFRFTIAVNVWVSVRGNLTHSLCISYSAIVLRCSVHNVLSIEGWTRYRLGNLLCSCAAHSQNTKFSMHPFYLVASRPSSSVLCVAALLHEVSLMSVRDNLPTPCCSLCCCVTSWSVLYTCSSYSACRLLQSVLLSYFMKCTLCLFAITCSVCCCANSWSILYVYSQ